MIEQFARVGLADLVIRRDQRQRRQVKLDDGLRESIAKNGVLVPIIVRQDGSQIVLVAGERRVEACKSLDHSVIPAVFIHQLSPVEARIVELEENLKRLDLDWRDQVRAEAEIHQLYRDRDPDWTMAETAEALSMSKGHFSEHLRVASLLASGHARVKDAGSIREAYNIIARSDDRAAGDALAELLEAGDGVVPRAQDEGELPGELPEPNARQYTPEELADRSIIPLPVPRVPSVERSIQVADFRQWAPVYTGRKFNFIHCDFPYGINFASGPQGKGAEPESIYSDTADDYWGLVSCLGQNLDRLLAVSGHLMFWLSSRIEVQAKTLAEFARLAPSLQFYPHALVWQKSDQAGIASDPRKFPRHTYETALFATRGKRPILKVVNDAYSAPTDKRLHVSTKPEPMLRHFMQMVVDENTTMLDPTCGSGAALRAAESLGARQVLGLEIDPASVDVARQALRTARLMAAGSKAIAQTPASPAL